MHAASEYVAVNSSGRKVAGPFRDYGEARLYADRAGGYVVFVSDIGANDCVGVHTHGAPGPAVIVAGEDPTMQQMRRELKRQEALRKAIYKAVERGERHFYTRQGQLFVVDPTYTVYVDDQPVLTNAPIFDVVQWLMSHGTHSVGPAPKNKVLVSEEEYLAAEEDAKFERCVQHVKASGSAVNPWAVCHARLGEAAETDGNKIELRVYGERYIARRKRDRRGGPWIWEVEGPNRWIVAGVYQDETGWRWASLVDETIRDPQYTPLDVPANTAPEEAIAVAIRKVSQEYQFARALHGAGRANEHAAETGHRCTAESASAIAQQIPGGPWQHEGTYPAGAQARVDHEKEHSVTIDGKAQTIRVRYCGSHLILRCPTSGEQHLFKKTCIADVPVGKPQRGRVPAAPGVDAEPGKRFVLRVRKGRSTVSEFGPFKQITEAVDKMNELGQPGETATIYDGAKIAMYRGGRAIFSFGRTRWSRA